VLQRDKAERDAAAAGARSDDDDNGGEDIDRADAFAQAMRAKVRVHTKSARTGEGPQGDGASERSPAAESAAKEDADGDGGAGRKRRRDKACTVSASHRCSQNLLHTDAARCAVEATRLPLSIQGCTRSTLCTICLYVWYMHARSRHQVCPCVHVVGTCIFGARCWHVVSPCTDARHRSVWL
jgi:hypothetical protein